MKLPILSLLLVLSLLNCRAQGSFDAQMVDSIARLAEQGNPVAQNMVGEWYYQGAPYDRDYGKAVQWWLRALKQENVDAAANLARCYLRGEGVTTDSLRAKGLMRRAIRLGHPSLLNDCKQAADAGDRWSAALLADIYKTGLRNGTHTVVPRDKELYSKYLEQAAGDTDDVKARLEVCMSLLNARKYKEAYKQFIPLAEVDNPTACFWIGKMLLEGIDTVADKAAGHEYLHHASQLGFPMADYYIGRSYAAADGVERNLPLAVKWYAKAAEGGNHYGLYFYGRALATGEGAAPNYIKAVHLLERAAAKGHKLAFTKLVNDTIPGLPFATFVRGLKLMQGGAYAGALKQFRLLERTDKAAARAMQGIVYCTPSFSDYNLKKGISLLRSAATADDPAALYTLGTYYLDGTGVKKDIKEGIKLLTRGAEAGSPKAMLTLADLYYNGKGVERDFAAATQYYLKASVLIPLSCEQQSRLLHLLKEQSPEQAEKLASCKYTPDLLPALLKSITVTE